MLVSLFPQKRYKNNNLKRNKMNATEITKTLNKLNG